MRRIIMKLLNKLSLIGVLFFNTATYAQLDIKTETRKLLIPKADSLEKFLALNKIDYALMTYSTSNWIALEHVFYAIVKEKGVYYLMRFANLDVYGKKPELKVNQKKLTKIKAREYLEQIASAEAFKFSDLDYHKLPTYCKVVHGSDTITDTGIDDNNTLNIFQHTKTTKSLISYYDPSYYLEKCYPLNPEYGILKGFVNTYDRLTELVSQAFKDDPIPPIQNRMRNH